ncbi:antichymotrypsin-2-like [Bombyx mandarina]|uniref:Antichymotrypsin-2-like n=1 Tax=Bombyx mandarina TaxID=7092 RepID=A0A6J2JAA9_BOMMA|nr:antichymotrypsin-2-like [Bombyx mandarina]
MKILYVLCIPVMASAIMYPQRILKTAQYESHNKVTSLEMKGNLKKYFALEAALMDPNANMVCSPISALFPLGKLALGAEKETAKELLNAIGVTSKIKLQRNLRKLIKSLRNVSGVRLDIASSLYVSKNTRISSNFLSDSEYIFKSGVQKVSFDYPEQTADEINKWGKWENPFETTMDGVFFSPSGHRKVKMIKQYNMYNYVKSNVLKSQIIELPYEGRNASFVIILPGDKQGLPLLLKELKLAPELLDTEMSKMKATNAILVMPKFKMQSEIDLKTLYTKIGVTSIFDSENSGLTKIAKGEKLIVSKAIQKAVIDLNEMGTEASAASALVITKLSLVERLHVEVNCPFLFLVKVNKNALFAGVLNDPEQ